MPDPAPTNPLHQAVDWTRQQAAGLLNALASLKLSKPAAEVVSVLEPVLEKVLPPALAAGEQAVAELLSANQWTALASLVGDVNAAIVQQYLARVPHAVDTAPKPAAQGGFIP